MKCPATGLQCDTAICTGMCVKISRGKTPGFSQAQDEFFAREKKTRIESEPGELWLHYKDGSQTRFSDAAAQTIADVVAAFEAGQPQPCCNDFANCKRMCIPRAEYWKERAERAEEMSRIEGEVERYLTAFSHIHVNKGDGTDTCKQCGLDLRDKMHFTEWINLNYEYRLREMRKVLP